MCYTWSVIWSVTMTVRFHLFPFRTQQLSSLVPKIVSWKRLVKIGSRRLDQNALREILERFLLCKSIYITKNRPRRVGALHAAGPMIYWGVYPLRRKLPLSPCRRSRTARSFPCTWPRWPLRREPAACGGRSPCPADPCPLRCTCGWPQRRPAGTRC